MKKISRRDFLKVFGASGLLLLQDNSILDAAPNFRVGKPLNIPSNEGVLGVFEPASPFTLTAKEISHQILPQRSTRLWVYELNAGAKKYINPIIRIKKGATLNTVLRNALAEPTIIHWHGLHVDFENDGHPVYQIQPAEEYRYGFQIKNRAGSYWYHTHAHQRTAVQAYYGLSSYFIVEDEEEEALTETLDLNFGETDIPLIVQDKTFASNGELLYFQSPMGTMDGFFGNTILTNLTHKPYLNVSTRIYRFRILNGSNARIYRFAFMNRSTAQPFHIIGNDGGLLDRPYQVTEVFLSPAERVDVLLDLSRSRPGDVVWLKSLSFDPMDMGMMGGRGMMGGGMGMGQSGMLPHGSTFSVLRLNVTKKIRYDKKVPDNLSSIISIDAEGSATRPFTLSSAFMTQWLINGLSFDMHQVPVTVQKDTKEIWQIENWQFSSPSPMGGMMGMSMPHPMHLHGFHFQILQRINSPYQIRRLALDSNGLLPTDKGFKDTVLVWPGEVVRIAVDFSHYFSGIQRYLFHCHILEHEDNGMMINYEVA